MKILKIVPPVEPLIQIWQKAYNCRDTTIPMVIERK